MDHHETVAEIEGDSDSHRLHVRWQYHSGYHAFLLKELAWLCFLVVFSVALLLWRRQELAMISCESQVYQVLAHQLPHLFWRGVPCV